MKKLILFIAVLVSFNLHSQCVDNHYVITNTTNPFTDFHVLIYDNDTNHSLLAQVESDQSLVTIDLSSTGGVNNEEDIIFIETVTQISGNSNFNSGGGNLTIPFPTKVYTMTESVSGCTRTITIN
jgi:hypothetical protein